MESAGNRAYRTLYFLVSYGDWVAAAVGAVPLLAGVALWLTGGSAWFAVGGVLAAAFLYLVMRSYVELVRVIVDMLLPK